jgi:hypothetical protein
VRNLELSDELADLQPRRNRIASGRSLDNDDRDQRGRDACCKIFAHRLFLIRRAGPETISFNVGGRGRNVQTSLLTAWRMFDIPLKSVSPMAKTCYFGAWLA